MVDKKRVSVASELLSPETDAVEKAQRLFGRFTRSKVRPRVARRLCTLLRGKHYSTDPQRFKRIVNDVFSNVDVDNSGAREVLFLVADQLYDG